MIRFIYSALASSALVTVPALAQAPAEAPATMPVTPSSTTGPEVISFDVPAGTLASVLNRIGDQARASISIEGDPAQTEAPTPAIRGAMTLTQAIGLALQDRGWRVKDGDAGTIVLERTDEGGGGSEIVVVARRTDFARQETSLLTRTKTSLRHTPGTIDSVTEEVIKSQNLLSVGEALRNIPGVIFQNQTTTQVVIAGQTNGGQTFTNGLRNSLFAGNAPITDVETVEVLKGPASILTGSQVSGGTVNFVPKRANGARLFTMSVGVGTGEEFIGLFDVGEALDSSAGVNYRLTGQMQRADHRPNGGNTPYSYAAGAMLGLRGETLDADIGFQIYETRNAFPDWYDFDPVTRIYRSYNDVLSRDQNTTVKSKRLNFGLEQELVDGSGFSLSFRTRGLYQVASQELSTQTPLSRDPLMASNLFMFFKDKQYSQYADIYAQFETGPLKHQFIVAGDFSNNDSEGNVEFGFIFPDPAPLLTSFSADPTYSNTKQYGLVVQDQIELGPLHLLLGLRKSWYRAIDYRPGGDLRYSDEDLSPSGGVVLDITKDLSIYASIQKGFTPVPPGSQRSIDGRILPPTIRHSREVGFKAGLFGDKLTVNGSYNWYTTKNEIRFDEFGFTSSGPGSSGKIWEISVAGSIAPSLNVLAGYVHHTVENVDGFPDIGNPAHVANFWLIKTFRQGQRVSFDLGFGANYNSAALAQDIRFFPAPTVKLDDFLAFRLAAGAKINKTRLNLTVENLFDRKNYEPALFTSSVVIAPPRVVRFVVTQEF